MRENSYQTLMENIHTPAGLNDRVLSAARRRKGPAPRRRRPALRAAVCAACALALVLGSLTFRPAEGEEAGGVPAPSWSFGLTAWAADAEEAGRSGANSALAMETGGGMHWSAESGYYTGCMFQITGERIESVSLSLDRGELYRCRLLTDLTEEDVRGIREAQAAGTMAPSSIDRETEDAGAWSTQEMTRLGESVTEDYDPEARYGFWVPGVEEALWREDPREASWASVDQLDGASLTVRVTFADGTAQTEVYRLSTGKLRAVWNDDGTMGLLPGLAGDDEAYFYGVYAASESKSRWFRWPVAGANTVCMSSPFGPQSGGAAAHDGIDIPAGEGTPVAAAMDGTVKETGFDARRGNYLVLDHGEGLETVYAQCRQVTVRTGDAVKAGQTVAAVGSTGMSTGPHLCFQVRQDGAAQDPVAYFDSAVRDALHMG